MRARLNALVAKLDRIPPKKLLLINAGLACLVGIAHGGALALSEMKPGPESEFIKQIASVSLPAVAVMLVSSAAALVRSTLLRGVLGLHGFVLALGGIASLAWAASLLVRGIPQGVSFSWTPGLLSLIVVYSIFLFTRYGVPPTLAARPALLYAPSVALLVALPIDFAVFFLLLREITKGVGDLF